MGSMSDVNEGRHKACVISPLLANIFLHLAFDQWMHDTCPDVPFERYAEDIVVHCRSEAQAQEMHARIDARLRRCDLELHPEKTRIVCCDVGDRERVSSFDFPGFTFRPRLRNRRPALYSSRSARRSAGRLPCIGKKRVARLMRQEGIVAKRRKKFRITTDSKHTDPIAPNILNREFNIAQPNTAWVTDVTYVWTHQGWLYLAAILDLCSRRVVGWSAGANNDRALALEALERAKTSRQPRPGLLHHSDRGSVYASLDYEQERKLLG
jgi:hypothetical protein